MKITKLEIKNYRNLDTELNHKSDIIALIGNNGSGKSNILEALSHIFRNLYVNKHNINFDYCIEYETSKKNKVKIYKQGKEKKYLLDEKEIHDITHYLPKKIVAIYSGEETRLLDDCFSLFYSEFVNNINKSQSQGTEYSELPKMLYLDKSYWNISLLSLLVSDSDDNKKFVEDILKIKEVDKIKIDFRKKNYEKYNDNRALRFIRDIDSKSEYTLPEFKTTLSNKSYSTDALYKYLYIAYFPKEAKIVTDITIKFNRGLSVSDLSEGEKKLLLVKGALEFAGQEDCLFMLDEPDSHIHIGNKKQITRSFEPYQHNRQIIITSHSPTIVQTLKDENIYMLNNGKIENKNRQKAINRLTEGFWNLHEQNIFISSNKPIILLVEGKYDETFLNNAFEHYKIDSNYSNISFEIFNTNGADNLVHLAKGLYSIEQTNDKLYIFILDSDQKGKEIYNKIKGTFKKASHNYKVFTYLEENTNNNHEGDFTVENLFDYSLYKKAFTEILTDEVFKQKSPDKISKALTKLAKQKLAESSKNFTKEEFKNFKFIFDKIKGYYEDFLSKKKDSETVDHALPLDKEYLRYKTSKKIWNNFLKIKEEVLKYNPEIEFKNKKTYISVFSNKRSFSQISFRKKNLNIKMLFSESLVKQYIPSREDKTHKSGTSIKIFAEDEDFTDAINVLIEMSKIRRE